MHPYELKIMEYMQTVATQSVAMSDDFFKPVLKDIEYYSRKMFEDDPKRPFTLRLSAIGKPLCQQQMEQSKATAVEDEWNHPLRMFFGGVIEATTVAILRHAGLKIQSEQGAVKLRVPVKVVCDVGFVWDDPRILWDDVAKENYTFIPGTYDLELDDGIWDVKSASSYSFKEKFASYESLAADDTFGYLPQLYGYAKAKGKKPGGWFVIDKSSGIIKVISVPDNWQEESERCLKLIETNTYDLLRNAPFKRCFTDKDETFKKRFTGNKVLDFVCTYCKFRYSCWKGLQYLPSKESKSFDPPYKYYTQITTESLKDEHTISES